jgi:hypothetical protein
MRPVPFEKAGRVEAALRVWRQVVLLLQRLYEVGREAVPLLPDAAEDEAGKAGGLTLRTYTLPRMFFASRDRVFHFVIV